MVHSIVYWTTLCSWKATNQAAVVIVGYVAGKMPPPPPPPLTHTRAHTHTPDQTRLDQTRGGHWPRGDRMQLQAGLQNEKEHWVKHSSFNTHTHTLHMLCMWSATGCGIHTHSHWLKCFIKHFYMRMHMCNSLPTYTMFFSHQKHTSHWYDWKSSSVWCFRSCESYELI